MFTVRTPWLLWTLLYATLWVLVFVGPEEVLLPFLIRERIGEDPRWFGFLLAVYGLGGVLGSIFVSSRKLPRRYLTTMNLVWGISTLPFIDRRLHRPVLAAAGVACSLRLRLQLRQRHLGDAAAAARADATCSAASRVSTSSSRSRSCRCRWRSPGRCPRCVAPGDLHRSRACSRSLFGIIAIFAATHAAGRDRPSPERLSPPAPN